MEAVTIIISLFGSLVALALRPVGALALYVVVLFCYPQPLTLKLGTVEFSSSRIIILAVLINALFIGTGRRKFRFNKLDLFILIAFLAQTLSYCLNEELIRVLKWRGGVLFDTLLPYFATRLIITSKDDFVRLIKALVVAAIPLAICGAIEAKTGHNVVGFMQPYYSWGLAADSGDPINMRHGLYRASVTIGNSIIFGLLFAGLIPLCPTLLTLKGWRRESVFLAMAFLALGMFSSLSSAPLFSFCISCAMLAVFRWRRYWPLFLAAVLAWMVFVEVFSNRHFYHVLTLLSFDQETAYYRIALIEEAFGGGMSGHWLTGYGFVGLGPGNDNSKFLWENQDLTNIYILVLVRTGLLGLIPYLVMNFYYYRRLYLASNLATTPADAWIIWCLAATLVGWNISLLTVSAMVQVETLLYMFLALSVNMPLIIASRAAAAQAVPARQRPGRQRRFRRLEWNYNA